MVVPSSTWQAYNQWPRDGRQGRSLYHGFDRGGHREHQLRARQVSFDRPYHDLGTPSRFGADREAIAFLEGSGYDVTYAASHDLHNGTLNPALYKGIIFVGHDEYWSAGMREHATAALNTGVAGAFPASNPADVLVDLVYALKAGYRQNASFVMNRKTQGAIRKFKDANGNYLWQPPASAGAPATLLGFPLVEAEDMPNIAANAVSIAFGDFRRGYLVVDRAGVRILRDPYSAKPYVLFYTTKRVGGGVQDFAAIKGLKFAA